MSLTKMYLLAGASDPDGDRVTLLGYDYDIPPSVSFAEDGGFQFDSRISGAGRMTFHYTVMDDYKATEGTITIDVIDAAPIVVGRSYTVDTDGVLDIAAPDGGVLAEATDPDGDPISTSVVTGPAHGALVLTADGRFTYTPEAGFTGQDSFVHAVSDGLINTRATVYLNVVAPPAAGAAAPHDLSGDGIADILWRNTDGSVAAWRCGARSARACNWAPPPPA